MRALQESAAGLETSFVSDILLPVALGLIMLGMGMGLRLDHFKELGRRPTVALAALGGQVLLLPIAACLVVYAWTTWFGLEFELALGVLLLAAVPGGATSNMLSFLARGDVALSVSLTAVTSVGSFLLAPASLWATTTVLYGSPEVISVSIVEVLKLTLAVVAGPVILGMLIGRFWPRAATRVDKPLRVASVVILAVLIVGVILQNREDFWSFAAATIPAAAALNVLALAAGYGVARMVDASQAQTRSTVIEVGFQNGTFAILLAVSQLESARAALMPGFYSLFMFASGAALALWWARRSPDDAPPSEGGAPDGQGIRVRPPTGTANPKTMDK